MRTRGNAYTVVGVYPDDQGSFVDHVLALTPTLAARVCRRRLNEPDAEVIAVFEGKLKDVYDDSLDNDDYEAEVLRDAATEDEV